MAQSRDGATLSGSDNTGNSATLIQLAKLRQLDLGKAVIGKWPSFIMFAAMIASKRHETPYRQLGFVLRAFGCSASVLAVQARRHQQQSIPRQTCEWLLDAQ